MMKWQTNQALWHQTTETLSQKLLKLVDEYIEEGNHEAETPEEVSI
jgi:hypothetical protein